MRGFWLWQGERSEYNRCMRYLRGICDAPSQEQVEFRVHVLEFAGRRGVAAAVEAFQLFRSTVFAWQKRIRDGGGRLESLRPGSRAPKKRRQRQIEAQVIEFIRKYRIQKPGLGKGIIKAELDRFSRERGLKTLSESSVGRVIADLKAAGRLPGRGLQFKVIDHSGRLIRRTVTQRRKKNRRNGYQPQKPGDLLQMDSLAIFQDGIKRYMLSAIDLNTRFGFAYSYTALNSRNATDFLRKLIRVAPFPIHRIQTDNGGEFEKHFVKAVRDSPIEHFNTYPNHPQSNAFVERFNRTLRSQFLQYYEQDISDTKPLNLALIDYLIWYNTQKPHLGIGSPSPMEYYMHATRLNNQKSNMLWTRTTA